MKGESIVCGHAADDIAVFAEHGYVAREIANYPGYLVTSCGKVFSRRRSLRNLRQYWELRACLRRQKAGRGQSYYSVVLCNPSGKTTYNVHRIVATTFHPNPGNLPCVRHKNGDTYDNSAENLAWATYAENEADKRDHGTWFTRYLNGKLSPEDRDLIRSMDSEGMTQVKIGKIIGVSNSAVSRLVNGTSWKEDSQGATVPHDPVKYHAKRSRSARKGFVERRGVVG